MTETVPALEDAPAATFGSSTFKPSTATHGGMTVDTADIPEEFRNRVVAVSGEIPQYIDFFDVLEEFTYTFPDKVQYVTLKAMTEGDRKRYLNKTNREVRMNTGTKELRMQAAAGDDKHSLLEQCITNWYVLRQGAPVPFSSNNLKAALEAWPPSLVDRIEKRIREINPWLLGDEDNIDALRDEREDLDRRIKTLEERKAKN